VDLKSVLYGFIAVVLAYAIGSLSFGVLISRFLGRDVRQSDAPGASGMIRQFGWGVGLLTTALDFGKGALAVWVVQMIAPGLVWFVPLLVVVGHCWPVFFGFNGGQGLIPMFGAMMAISPAVIIPCMALGFALMGVHKAFKLKRFVRLNAQPFAGGTVLPLGIALAWSREGSVVWPLLLMAVAMLTRGLQVLRHPISDRAA
jgi:acyl phosphate:glycerol-3-phosphate acyltransferase